MNAQKRTAKGSENRGYFPKGRVRIVFHVSKFHGRTVSFKAGVTPISATFMAEVLPS